VQADLFSLVNFPLLSETLYDDPTIPRQPCYCDYLLYILYVDLQAHLARKELIAIIHILERIYM
jgi:hypothetical protein